MNELINFDGMDFNDLQTISNKIMVQQLGILNKHILELQDKQEKSNKQIEILNDELCQTKELVINDMRNKAILSEYMNQTDFGNNFRIKIGAKSVGNLFRVIGIALKSRIDKTIPYDTFCPTYAKPSSFTNKSTGHQGTQFKWNYKKCLEKVEDWMIKHELLEQFYSIGNEKEMELFINNLHDTYILHYKN